MWTQAHLASAGRRNQNNGLLRTEPPSRLPESLSGLIHRVTCFSEDSGYIVLKVNAKGHRNLVAVVGSLASVRAGERVTAEGVLESVKRLQEGLHRLAGGFYGGRWRLGSFLGHSSR